MDTAVALVQAFLNVNGYFTVVEYPVLEAYRHDHARAVTDLDVLAFRFAGAGHDVIRGHHHGPLSGRELEPDSVLGCPADRPDMIARSKKGRLASTGNARSFGVVDRTRATWLLSA